MAALDGLASEGASKLVKKITGVNLLRDVVHKEMALACTLKKMTGGQVGGFLIPQYTINQLIAYKHLLTNNQKTDILNALQTGSDVRIQPTKTQLGNGLGIVLATTGILLVVELVKKVTGRGAPRIGSYKKQDGHGAPRLGVYQPPPPFIGTWKQMRGGGKKKRTQKGKGLLLGPNSPFKIQFTIHRLGHHTVKPKFHKNIPMSHHDLLEWCRYLNIPIKSVLARDQNIPHNHKQSLFIYNLAPSYMNGSHWVATYVKDGVMNYFDSFGMPPFQEIVNHARSKNLTLLHQDNQIQNVMTTTCGYFCFYFLNEMNKGTTYYDLLGAFDMHDTMKNEWFIKKYFKIV